ncbi:hypothetical protein ADUPG1_010832, partial [Aduncisulcus paluster]
MEEEYPIIFSSSEEVYSLLTVDDAFDEALGRSLQTFCGFAPLPGESYEEDHGIGYAHRMTLITNNKEEAQIFEGRKDNSGKSVFIMAFDAEAKCFKASPINLAYKVDKVRVKRGARYSYAEYYKDFQELKKLIRNEKLLRELRDGDPQTEELASFQQIRRAREKKMKEEDDIEKRRVLAEMKARQATSSRKNYDKDEEERETGVTFGVRDVSSEFISKVVVGSQSSNFLQIAEDTEELKAAREEMEAEVGYEFSPEMYGRAGIDIRDVPAVLDFLKYLADTDEEQRSSIISGLKDDDLRHFKTMSSAFRQASLSRRVRDTEGANDEFVDAETIKTKDDFTVQDKFDIVGYGSAFDEADQDNKLSIDMSEQTNMGMSVVETMAEEDAIEDVLAEDKALEDARRQEELDEAQDNKDADVDEEEEDRREKDEEESDEDDDSLALASGKRRSRKEEEKEGEEVYTSMVDSSGRVIKRHAAPIMAQHAHRTK